MKHPLFKNANAMEEIARLRESVESRASVIADGASTLFDDAQMENPKHQELGCIFLTAAMTEDGTDLLFIAERTIYNPATDRNVPAGVESFRSDSFSEWMRAKRRDGWRFCG